MTARWNDYLATLDDDQIALVTDALRQATTINREEIDSLRALPSTGWTNASARLRPLGRQSRPNDPELARSGPDCRPSGRAVSTEARQRVELGPGGVRLR